MTLRLFLAVVWVSVGLLAVGKVYQGTGNYKLFKICNLTSSVMLVITICAVVVKLVLSIGQTFF